MVKKITIFATVVFIFISCLALPVSADYQPGNQATNELGNIQYYADGSYSVTTISIKESDRATVKTISKDVKYYDSDGSLAVTLTVTGVFNVGSGSVTCTSATYSTVSHQSNWSIVSPSASHANHGSYATATASGTAKKKVLGITIKSVSLSVTITCNSDGSYS